MQEVLERANRPRPCRLNLESEVYTLRSFEALRNFSFELIRAGNFVSSHGRIVTWEEMGFDKPTQAYIEYMLQYPVKFWEYCRVLDMLPYVAGQKILDVGGGSSPISFYLASQDCVVEIIDYELAAGSRSIIDNSNQIARKYGWQLTARYGSATSLPYEQSSFDHVISVSTLEHVGPFPEQVRALQEAFRILKPGGMFALTFDFGAMRGTKGHYPIRESQSIRRLIDTTRFRVVGNSDFEDIDYNSSEIQDWEKQHRRFCLRGLRWNRWYTAFSLFLMK